VAAPALRLSYAPPALAALFGAAVAAPSPTSGGTAVTLAGSNFGPLGSAANATYTRAADGRAYAAIGCAVVTADTAIQCLLAPGTGAGYAWRAVVGAQASAPCAGCALTAYLPPVVASFAGAAAAAAGTPGGDAIIIAGSNFGPGGPGAAPVTAYYGTSNFNGTGAFRAQFNATGCAVSVPHVQITCTTGAGAGAGLQWRVTVDGQQSVQMTTAYAPPSVAAVDALDAGVSAASLSPDGGQRVRLSGANLGASSAWLGAVTYGTTGYEYAAVGCNVTAPHAAIVCSTAPGSGVDHVWVVVVGGQGASWCGGQGGGGAQVLLARLGRAANACEQLANEDPSRGIAPTRHGASPTLIVVLSRLRTAGARVGP
jgi:hypothetical protein